MCEARLLDTCTFVSFCVTHQTSLRASNQEPYEAHDDKEYWRKRRHGTRLQVYVHSVRFFCFSTLAREVCLSAFLLSFFWEIQDMACYSAQ